MDSLVDLCVEAQMQAPGGLSMGSCAGYWYQSNSAAPAFINPNGVKGLDVMSP